MRFIGMFIVRLWSVVAQVPATLERLATGRTLAARVAVDKKDSIAARGVPSTTARCQTHKDFPSPMKKRPEKPKYKTLLAIDGGGLRGVVPAIVLEQVERAIIDHIKARHPELKNEDVQVDLADYFDLIGGTSVGSILTAYFATKGKGTETFLASKEVVDRYGELRPGSAEAAKIPFMQRGNRIFQKSRIVPRSVKQVLLPKFGNGGLTETLKEMFGDAKLSDCETSLVIPSFELKSSRPYMFWVNHKDNKERTGCAYVRVRNDFVQLQTAPSAAADQARNNSAGSSTSSGCSTQARMLPAFSRTNTGGVQVYDPDLVFEDGRDFKLLEVVRASASAPTFFPAAPVVHEYTPKNGKTKRETKLYVDGGVIANNPTIHALNFMCSRMHTPLEKIAVLSIGTCNTVPDLECKRGKGLLGWAADLFGVLLDRQSEYLQSIVDSVFYQVLANKTEWGQYTRIQRSVDATHKDASVLGCMDDPNKLSRLQEIGEDMARASKGCINNFVERFIFGEEDENDTTGDQASL